MTQLAIAGLAAGIAYSAIGVCLVLVRQVSDLVNVAQGIIGGIGAYSMLAANRHGAPLTVAVPVGVATGAIIAGTIGFILARGFAAADATTKTAASIGVTIALLAVAQRVFGHEPELFPVLLGGRFVTIGSVVIAVVTLVGAGALVVFGIILHVGVRRTRVGVRMWAVCLRPKTAELLGVRRTAITVATWALAGAVSTAGLLVVTPTRQSDLTAMTVLVVPALAAALVGGLRSIPVALAAGVTIGMSESVLLEWSSVAQYRQALSFVVIVVVLLVTQRKAVWDEAR